MVRWVVGLGLLVLVHDLVVRVEVVFVVDRELLCLEIYMVVRDFDILNIHFFHRSILAFVLLGQSS